MKKIFLFFLLFCSSCFRSNRPTITENNELDTFTDGSFVYYPIKDNKITVDLDDPQSASLFDYFSHIELVPLETRDDVLIGWLTKVIYHQNRYYTFCEKQFIVQVFDENGKYICQIGRRGRGPGEYNFTYDFIINPFTDNIDILGPLSGFIYSYDLSGNYVKTSGRVNEFEPGLTAVHKLLALSKNIYIIYAIGRLKNPYKIFYYDVGENRIIHKEYVPKDVASFSFNGRCFYEYYGQWYFSFVYDPVVYTIGSTSLEKAYVWDLGKHNYNTDNIVITEEMLRDTKKGYEEISARFPYWLDQQGQNNRYVIAQIRKYGDEWNKLGNLIFDKKTQICKYVERLGFTETVGFRPHVVTNEYVLSYCAHEELDEYLNADILDEENRKKLETLMDAKVEQNPVIIKYYFK
jgi:hypothetical protein